MDYKTEILPISKLHPNKGQVKGLPKNPRFVRDDKFNKLKQSLTDDPEFMQLREIVAYDNNGELVIIGGNMRYRALKDLGIKEAPVKVLPSDTPLQKLRAFTIKDNAGFGEWDWDDLANEWDTDELEGWGVDVPVQAEDEDSQYTRLLHAPTYEITGDAPMLAELQDGEKVDELNAEIDAADVDEDIKAFLHSAAERHRVFNYAKIAEYYAHAPKEVQALFEKSALVIIDFNSAVENGFVELSEKLFKIIGEDYA